MTPDPLRRHLRAAWLSIELRFGQAWKRPSTEIQNGASNDPFLEYDLPEFPRSIASLQRASFNINEIRGLALHSLIESPLGLVVVKHLQGLGPG